jgi:putative heme iron utilization protein
MNNAIEARKMLRAHRYGALATHSKKFDGYPFGSITPYLTDHDGSLVILISGLAEHTKNILHNPRVSLITHDQHDAQIQTQGRITLLGDAEAINNRDAIGARFLRYFPEAESYFQMHDFAFYRIRPIAIRYIGGFGKIHWVNTSHYIVPSYPLIAQESDVIEHMNADHLDTMRQYCLHLHQRDVLDVAMLGIDCDGFDMRADGEILRIDFAAPIHNAQQARAALVDLARATKFTHQ